MSIERLPAGKRGARCRHCGIDVGLGALCDAREHLAIRRIDDVECLARFGPVTVDEVAEDLLVFREPVASGLIGLGGRPVFHRFENIGDRSHWTPGTWDTGRGAGPTTTAGTDAGNR